MNTNAAISIVIAILVIIGGFFLFSTERAQAPENGGAAEENNITEDATSSEDNIEDIAKNISTTPTENDNATAETMADEEVDAVEENPQDIPEESTGEKIITYTGNNYSPSTITIFTGETVTFVNKSTRDMWPASALHPTHTIYPNSDIEKCGATEKEAIFDACRGIPQGESWSFTFNEIGEWEYHDHLNPRSNGTIIVGAP